MTLLQYSELLQVCQSITGEFSYTVATQIPKMKTPDLIKGINKLELDENSSQLQQPIPSCEHAL